MSAELEMTERAGVARTSHVDGEGSASLSREEGAMHGPSSSPLEDELVEYVAMAIWRDDDDDPWREQNENTKEVYRIEARDAIVAVREWDAQHG